MADVRSTTTYYGMEKFTRGHPVRDVDIGENMDIIDDAMEANRVAVTNASASGAGYWFDGTDDVIVVADDANVDFDADDDFYIEMSVMPLDVTRTTDYLINKEAGGVGYGLYVNQDDLYIRIDDNAADASAIIGTAVFSNNVKAKVLVSFDRNGNATAYVDGELVGTVDISAVTATLASAGDLHIGNDSAGTNEFYGEIYYTRIGNTAQTLAEALTSSNGAPVPYKYLGASQTNRLSEPDFATHAKWDVAGDFDDSGGNAAYTWASNTTSTLTQTSANLAAAMGDMKRYKLTYTCVVSTAPDGDLAMTLTTGVASAAVTLPFTAGTHVVEFMSKTAPANFVVSATCSTGTEGTFTLDDMSLVPIGCVLQLEPDGVGTTQWTDTSGNYINGVVTGAAAINVPPDQGGVRVASGALADGNTGTYAFTWQNPEAVEVLVQRVIIDVTTDATAAAAVDVDVVASATDTGTGIFDTLLVNAVATNDHMLVAGTGAGGVHKMAAKGGGDDWVTGKIKTQHAADLVGKYYIEYVPV